MDFTIALKVGIQRRGRNVLAHKLFAQAVIQFEATAIVGKIKLPAPPQHCHGLAYQLQVVALHIKTRLQ